MGIMVTEPANRAADITVSDRQNQPTSRSTGIMVTEPANRAADITVSDRQNQPTNRSAGTGNVTVTDRQNQPTHRSAGIEVSDRQSQPTKRSTGIAVTDRQSQPTSQPAGRESPVYSWQPPLERHDVVSQSYTGDLDYRNPVASTAYHRFESGEDSRRVGPPDAADFRSRLDAAREGRYGGRFESGRSGYQDRYYGGDGERRELFWNELSAYCDEYEARMGQRGDVSDVDSRRPRSPPADYSRDFSRLRAGDSSMFERRGDVDNRPLPSDYLRDFDRPRTRDDLLPERRGDVDDRERLRHYAERGAYW